MTTKQKKEIFRNLWKEPGWPLFSRAAERFEAAGSPDISALTLTWSGSASSLSATLAVAAAETRKRLERAVSRLPTTAWLFLAQTPWQPRSAAVRYRRIWKELGSKYDLSQLRMYEEICIESEVGIRYAAIASVPVAWLMNAIAVCRSFQFGCLLLGPPGDEFPLTTERLFSVAFRAAPGRPAETDVDWPSLTSAVCSQGSIAVRESLEAAEGTVTVDLFMNEGQLETFQRTVEEGERLQ